MYVLFFYLSCLFVLFFIRYASIKRMLEQTTSRYVFVKDESSMKWDEIYLQYLPDGYGHSFLIRHPVLSYSSMRIAHYKQSSEGGLLSEGKTDLGCYDMRKHCQFFPHRDYYQSLHSLWKYVRENIDPCPVVIDSSDVLSKPAEMLPKYCEAIGFPYSESLLDLDVPFEELEKWVWPANLLETQSFMTDGLTSKKLLPPKTPLPRDQLSDDIVELSSAAMPYYNEMYENRLTV